MVGKERMLAEFTHLQLEETADRLKITWPVPRNWFLFVLFSLALLVWLVMLVVMAVYLVRDVVAGGERFTFILSAMVLVWLFVWLRFGRILWQRWQYYTAIREIMFIDQERLIVRRPVSILGITDAYDMQHVSPFYYSDKHRCPAFDYGYQHVYFGLSLTQEEAEALAAFLNGRFFPDMDDEWGDGG